jgi:hypothetical protein
MEIKWIINSLLIILLHAGLAGIFIKARRQFWEALIPGYNLWIWIKIVEKPWWWLILLLIPGVNIMLFLVLVFLTLRNFEIEKPLELILGLLFSFFYLPYVALAENTDGWVMVTGNHIKNYIRRMAGGHRICCSCCHHHPNFLLRSIYHTQFIHGKNTHGWRLSLREQTQLWKQNTQYTANNSIYTPYASAYRIVALIQ